MQTSKLEQLIKDLLDIHVDVCTTKGEDSHDAHILRVTHDVLQRKLTKKKAKTGQLAYEYDWTNVPTFCNWLATDANGSVHAFVQKPDLIKKRWYSPHVCCIFKSALITNNGNWKNSLCNRPNL